MIEVEIDTPSGSIYGRASGGKESPLVLGIHGWSQRNGWQTWEPLLQPLGEAGFYAVSVDMPGWGQSEPWESGTLSNQQAVAAVMHILDGLGKEAAVLMGKSWGGGVALQAALTYPERITGLILTAPAYRSTDRLNQLVQPVLLVWAEDDPVIPFSYAAAFEAAIPQATLVTYPTGGHSAAPKNAEAFAPRAVRFLKQFTVAAQPKR